MKSCSFKSTTIISYVDPLYGFLYKLIEKIAPTITLLAPGLKTNHWCSFDDAASAELFGGISPVAASAAAEISPDSSVEVIEADEVVAGVALGAYAYANGQFTRRNRNPTVMVHEPLPAMHQQSLHDHGFGVNAD